MGRTHNTIMFFNGSFVHSQEVRLPLSAPGILCGFGLFETMRSYRGYIVYRNKHLERLKDSAQRIGLKVPYPQGALEEYIRQTVEKNSLKDAVVRLTLWDNDKEAILFITAYSYEAHSQGGYRRGLKAQISTVRVHERSPFAGMKTTSYMNYLFAYRAAGALGFDEAIMLDSRDNISEGSRSNVFFVKGGELYTPSPACGCLAGITRCFVMDWAKEKALRVHEGEYPVSDLMAGAEVFMTNSLMGVMPIVSIDGQDIGNGKPGEITRFLVESYYTALTNAI